MSDISIWNKNSWLCLNNVNSFHCKYFNKATGQMISFNNYCSLHWKWFFSMWQKLLTWSPWNAFYAIREYSSIEGKNCHWVDAQELLYWELEKSPNAKYKSWKNFQLHACPWFNYVGSRLKISREILLKISREIFKWITYYLHHHHHSHESSPVCAKFLAHIILL